MGGKYRQNKYFLQQIVFVPSNQSANQYWQTELASKSTAAPKIMLRLNHINIYKKKNEIRSDRSMNARYPHFTRVVKNHNRNHKRKWMEEGIYFTICIAFPKMMQTVHLGIKGIKPETTTSGWDEISQGTTGYQHILNPDKCWYSSMQRSVRRVSSVTGHLSCLPKLSRKRTAERRQPLSKLERSTSLGNYGWIVFGLLNIQAMGTVHLRDESALTVWCAATLR